MNEYEFYVKDWGVMDIRYNDPHMFLEEMSDVDYNSVEECWEILEGMWDDNKRDMEVLKIIWTLLKRLREKYNLPIGALEPPGDFERE